MPLPNRMAVVRALAGLALLWEALWPALLPLICVLGLFAALALLGLPALLPGWLHAALLALFGLLLAGAAWFAVRRWRAPTPQAVTRRLERDSGLAHRPLATLRDRPANSHDAMAAALWRAHQRRAQGQLRGLRVGLPRPGLPRSDPWSLRALVFLLLAAGLLVGWSEAPQRLGRALQPDFSIGGTAKAELEAWINPPDYTGLPPMKLNPENPETLRLAQGSMLEARVFGGRGVPRLSIDGAVTPFKRIDGQNHELSLKIEAGRRLSVAMGGDSLADWPLDVIVDQPPTIETGDPPKVTVRQALRLSYRAADDYGLAKVWAELRLAPAAPDADTGAGAKADHSGPSPAQVLRLDLPLSPPGAREAAEAGYFDLTPHAWAGLRVQLSYLASDEKGQIGRSEPLALRLPEREFRHPVARAIIEQRRNLARRPGQRPLVALALAAIASGPETYGDDQVAYLALWTAARRLQLSRDEPAAAVLELLWQVALRIEDGGLSLAERELRAAQDALMAALAEGADQAEIERLMDQLQQAMEKYLQALAEQADRSTQAQGPQPVDPNARSVDAQELQKMMDRIRELSRLGAMDAAREMLRQLQEMLESLDGRRMTAGRQGGGPGEKAMRQLGELLQRQQDLMDRTYQQTPRRRRLPWEPRQGETQGQGQGQGQSQGKNGPAGEGGGADGGTSRAMDGLAGRQGALRRQLGEVMRQLGEGMGQIPEAMGGVDQAMRNAQNALRSGRGGQALSSQRSAIDGLARSFRELAEQMLGQAEDGNQGQYGQRAEDPAGRPFQGGGMDTSRVVVPNESELQRARRILDELRRRAGERARSRLERDYINRLLDRF